MTTSTLTGTCSACGRAHLPIRPDVIQATRCDGPQLIGHSVYCPDCKVNSRVALPEGVQLLPYWMTPQAQNDLFKVIEVTRQTGSTQMLINGLSEQEAKDFVARLRGRGELWNSPTGEDGQPWGFDLNIVPDMLGDDHCLTRECYEAGTDWPSKEEVEAIERATLRFAQG